MGEGTRPVKGRPPGEHRGARACGRVRGSQIGNTRSRAPIRSNQGLAGGLGGGDGADWRERLPMGRGGAWKQKGELVLFFAVDLAGFWEIPRLSCVVGRSVLTVG